MFLFAFVACVLGVLHFVGELKKSIFDILEPVGRGLAISASSTDYRHVGSKLKLVLNGDLGRDVRGSQSTGGKYITLHVHRPSD